MRGTGRARRSECWCLGRWRETEEGAVGAPGRKRVSLLIVHRGRLRIDKHKMQSGCNDCDERKKTVDK